MADAKKRDELPTPQGKKFKFTTGGKAGRAPGLGTRNNSGLTPGQGVDGHPAKGYGLTASRRKPSESERTQSAADPEKPDDET